MTDRTAYVAEESSYMELFFERLAERLTDENDVSDILYAAIESIDRFRSVVVECLGLPSSRALMVTREPVLGGPRPDFSVKGGNQVVLVEVKLFDRDYHYESYNRLMIDGVRPAVKLLTAHKPDRDLPGWQVLQWRTLIEELEGTRDRTCLSLAKYFRRVTMSRALETFTLGQLSGIRNMNRALERVIEEYRNGDLVARINRAAKDSFSECSSGWCYELRSKSGGGRVAFPYFGLVYTDDRECVEISVRQSWHKNGWEDLVTRLSEFYGDRIKKDGEWYCVMMATPAFERLASGGNLEEQLKILGEFFGEYNQVIRPWIEGGSPALGEKSGGEQHSASERKR